MKGFSLYLLVFIFICAVLWGDTDGKSLKKGKKKAKVAKKSVKIVNGDEVTPHSMPYMAAIRTTINEKSLLCGGTLLRTSIVLTAARCVNGKKSVETNLATFVNKVGLLLEASGHVNAVYTDFAKAFDKVNHDILASEAEITLGAHNIDTEEESQVQVISSEFIIHPEYEDGSNLHDIALILLPTAVTLNENISTIRIPEIENITTDYDDELGLVAGWGKTSDTDPTPSSVLRAINVTVIPTLICELPYLLSLTFDQMCTTGVEKKNICLGDSGSPLIVNGVQVGIASYGSDFGCEVGLPGVYTRMTSYLSWLYINSDTYAEK